MHRDQRVIDRLFPAAQRLKGIVMASSVKGYAVGTIVALGQMLIRFGYLAYEAGGCIFISWNGVLI